MNAQPSAPVLGKILVIDDNPIIQRAVYFAFRDQGFKVFMSGEITEALNVVRKERPDVILLDLTFPSDFSVSGDRDGHWALGWLQKMEEARGIPIIVISSADAATTEPRVLAAGAAAFFAKPFDKEKLTATIRQLLKLPPEK